MDASLNQTLAQEKPACAHSNHEDNLQLIQIPADRNPLLEKLLPSDSDGGSDSVSNFSTLETNTNASISQVDDCDQLGSNLWSGADCYGSDSKLGKQVDNFFQAVGWQALASIATDYRDGIQCSYADPDTYSIGQFNMVRRLDFVDGVRWVARVRLPPEATHFPLGRYNSQRAFETEVASMKFFKSKSDIPVPEVFVYDPDSSNSIGAPYMLIEYIHGTTAEDLRSIRNSEPSIFGTSEQDQKFRQQMASIQARVLTFQFPKIGSLYHDESTDSFYIGPDMNTGMGPWGTPAEYYKDLTDSLLKQSAARRCRDPEKEKFFCAPALLNHLMSLYGQGCNGQYSLVNRDFGAHNILVDGDFNIVGVIDLDSVFAGPLEAVAQYPGFCGLDPEPPGIVETNPYALKRIEIMTPQLEEYKNLLMRYEAMFRNGMASISSMLGSRGAMIHLGFESCGEVFGFQNEVWFSSAVAMLKEHAITQCN